MKNNIIFLFFILMAASGCRFSSIGDVRGEVDYMIPDIKNNELNRLLYLKKQHIIDELNIKSIEKGVDTLEIRLWAMAGTAKGGEVYIIRKSKYKWNCYHYWFIERLPVAQNPEKKAYSFEEMANTGLDTFWIKKEEPRSGWDRFISKLNATELYKLESYEDVSSEVVEKINTYSFMIEYAMKNKYRLFWYNCSDIYKDCHQCRQMMGIFGTVDSEFNFSNSLLGNNRCRR
ncbi:MAG TPA: hypothetical protein VJ346_10690 [Bacteroidales bacterium]|nr:hypothetical protein [Bacteroidales bacterium]